MTLQRFAQNKVLYASSLSDLPSEGKIADLAMIDDINEFRFWDGAAWVSIGGSGTIAFTDLTDVPSSYVGQSLKIVRVNATETGLEFVSGGGGAATLQDAYDGGSQIKLALDEPVAIRGSAQGIAFGANMPFGLVVDSNTDNLATLFNIKHNLSAPEGPPATAFLYENLGDTSITFPAPPSVGPATDISFADSNPDTINSTTTNFVTAGFAAGDTITVSGSTSNNGTYVVASVSANSLTLDDNSSLTPEGAGASVTITTAANRVDFGVDLTTLPQPVAVSGKTTNLVSVSAAFLKSDVNVAADQGIYSIVGLANGSTTNSVAILNNAVTNVAANFTSTSGTAKISTKSAGFGGPSRGGASGNILLGTPSLGDGTTPLFAILNDKGSYASLSLLFNAGDISSAFFGFRSLLTLVNGAPTFGASADVPYIAMAHLGTPPNAGDIQFVQRTSHPTGLSASAEGQMWYRADLNSWFFWDGSNVQSLSASGVPTYFDARVGIGGDYSTVSSAVAAGKSRLRIISNVTETSDTTLIQPLLIYIDEGVTLNFASYSINGPFTCYFEGRGTVSYSYSIPQNLITSSSAQAIVKDMIIDNNSTSSDTQFCHPSARQSYTNVSLLAADVARGGIICSAPDNNINGLNVVGNSTSCSEAIDISNTTATNIFVKGTFSTSAPAIKFGNHTNATNIIFDPLANMEWSISGSIIDNVKNKSGFKTNLTLAYTYSTLSNAYLGSGNITYSSGSTNVKLINVDTSGTVDMSDPTATEKILIGCSFLDTNPLTIDGNGCKITDCSFSQPITLNANRCLLSNNVYDLGVTVNGARNIFMGGRTGNGTGGGTQTFSFSGTSSENYALGLLVDAAVTDSGTNNDISYKVY